MKAFSDDALFSRIEHRIVHAARNDGERRQRLCGANVSLICTGDYTSVFFDSVGAIEVAGTVVGLLGIEMAGDGTNVSTVIVDASGFVGGDGADAAIEFFDRYRVVNYGSISDVGSGAGVEFKAMAAWSTTGRSRVVTVFSSRLPGPKD